MVQQIELKPELQLSKNNKRIRKGTNNADQSKNTQRIQNKWHRW